MVFQLTTFQGVRYALFNYNTQGKEGGHADFDSIDVYQPNPHGLMRAIPYGQSIRLAGSGTGAGLHAAGAKLSVAAPTPFAVEDLGLGRVALRAGTRYLTIGPDGRAALAPGPAQPAQGFQWSETLNGELLLMSLATQRYLRIDPATGTIGADSPGPGADARDGVRFSWSPAAAPRQ